MQISLLKAIDAYQFTTGEISWEDFVNELSVHKRVAVKEEVGLWSPAQWFNPSDGRVDKNVRALSLAVFDFDKAPLADVIAVVDRLEAAGIAFVLHSTFSHSEAQPCFRLILLPSREILAQEWAALWDQQVKEWGGLVTDFTGKVPCRFYYEPSCPPEAQPIFLTGGSAPLDVDGLLQRAGFNLPAPAAPSAPKPAPVTPAKPLPPIRERPAPTTREEAIAILRTVKRKESRELLERVFAGEPLAEVGERDTTLQKVVSIIAGKLPTTTSDDLIVELIRPSVEKMPSDGRDVLTVEDALTKLGRAKERKLEFEQQRAIEDAELKSVLEKAAQARECVELTGEEPWTDEEWEQIAKRHGCTVEEFKHRLIIQRGRGFYVIGADGRYKAPLTTDDVGASIKRDLARAQVRFFYMTANGQPKEKTIKQLVEEYGAVARKTTASMSLQESYYDPATETFHEAACPMRRDLKPAFHPEVDRWLRLLFGRAPEAPESMPETPVEKKGLDWLASLTRIENPTAALYLSGAPKTGKTFLMKCCASLWGSTYADLSNVIADFNDALTRCPVVAADEEIEQNSLREFSTHQLRKLIASSERPLKRKFLATADLYGCVRLMLAANNDRLLETRESHTPEDMAAIAERFLHVQVGPAAAAYLASVGGRATTDQWVEKNWVEEHLLWLRDNRTFEPGKRLLVEGSQDSFANKLATHNAISSVICEWLVRFMTESKTMLSGEALKLIRIGEGRVLVATRLLSDKDRLSLYANCPTWMANPKMIGAALTNLSGGRTYRPRDGERIRYHDVKVEYLCSWSETTGYCEVDQLQERINKPLPA